MDISSLHLGNLVGAAVAFVLGLGLLARKPPDRGSIRNVLVLLGLFVLIELGARIADKLTADKLVAFATGLASFGIGAVLIRFIVSFGFRVVLPALRFTLARIIEDLTVTGLQVAWLMYWLHLVGLDPASLLTTSAVITAVLAFSMQDTLGNVLGGVVLQLDDSLKIGDWVKIDDISGQVVDVRWRHTAIETRNRETVVIPNGWLVKNRFTVIGSRSDAKTRWRRWVWFNVDAETSPSRVLATLEQTLKHAEIPNVLADPAPNAVLMEVGKHVNRYALRYWMNNPRADDPTDSEVRSHALAALARNGIRLAVPQEERLHIQELEQRNELLAEDIARRRRALDDIELFATLTDDERGALAPRLISAPFVKGDTMTRQGAVAHWLYLIASGEADIWAEDNGSRTHIATLQAGAVFGEMGMLTGEPRRATVTAKTDVECLRLDKSSFESILRARPDIAEELARVMVARRTELEAARENANARTGAVPQQAAMLAKIRDFFGLQS